MGHKQVKCKTYSSVIVKFIQSQVALKFQCIKSEFQCKKSEFQCTKSGRIEISMYEVSCLGHGWCVISSFWSTTLVSTCIGGGYL